MMGVFSCSADLDFVSTKPSLDAISRGLPKNRFRSSSRPSFCVVSIIFRDKVKLTLWTLTLVKDEVSTLKSVGTIAIITPSDSMYK